MNTALLELAQQLTADNLDEAMDGLAYEVAGTFLEELDEDNIRVRFRELMTNSIFYTLSRRCGQEPMDVLDDDDFIRIVDFNKLPVLSFLGNAVSEQCEAVLFDIGREMRKIYKKEITHAGGSSGFLSALGGCIGILLLCCNRSRHSHSVPFGCRAL